MGIKGYKHPGRKHPVVAVKPNGEIAGCFDYIKDAVNLYGMDRHSITDSCKRGTICRGLRWYYEEDFREIWMNGDRESLKYTLDPNRDRITYHFKKGHQFRGVLSEEGRRKKRSHIRKVAAMRKERGDYELMGVKLQKAVRCVDDGMEFPSRKEAGLYYGIPPHQICASITRNGRVHGLKFESL